MPAAPRILLALAGLSGALGVAAAAANAHLGGANLGTISLFLLVHAPALMGFALLMARGGRLASVSAALVAAGLVLFCGDLAAREFLGGRLFPGSAPIGGAALIAGWALMIPAAFLAPSDTR